MRKTTLIALSIIFLLCLATIAVSMNLISFNVIPDKRISAPSSSGITLITGGWGSAVSDFGRDDEGADGPTSFFVTQNGEIYLLDQLNKRIKVYDSTGKFQRTISIDRKTVEDIAVLPNGTIYLLDPILIHSVLQYDSSGKLIEKIPLNDNLKFSTALQISDGDLYAEDQHTSMYKVIENGHAVAPGNQISHKVPGRIKKNLSDTFLTAKRLDKKNFHINLTNAKGVIKQQIKTESKRDILQLLLLDSDLKGNTYVAMEIYEEGPPPDYKLNNSQIVVMKYDPQGKMLGKIELPNQYITVPFKKLEVDDDGNIYQLQTADGGVKLVKWQFSN